MHAMTDETREQLRSIYRIIHAELNAPAAATDRELDELADLFWEEEEAQRYWLGVPGWDDRPALVCIVHAARALNAGKRADACALLRTALVRIEEAREGT